MESKQSAYSFTRTHVLVVAASLDEARARVQELKEAATLRSDRDFPPLELVIVDE